MRPAVTSLSSFALQLCLQLLLLAGTAAAQPCGAGQLYLYVFDSAGQPVENLTVELLKAGSREPFYADTGGRTPDRLTGRGPQTEFIFATPAGGGTGEDVTIRYTAPGHLTHEETGAYLMGCRESHTAVVMRSFDAAGRPSLAGVVSDFLYENAEYYRQPNWTTPGRPLRGITVVAEKDGRQFRTATDAEGRYKFDALPRGEYVVYPELPKTLEAYDTNGFALRGARERLTVNTGIRRLDVLTASPQKHARGVMGDGLAVVAGEGELTARADFLVLPSGRIGGLFECAYDTRGTYLYFYPELRRFNPRTKKVEDVPLRSSPVEPVPSGTSKAKSFSFTFYQVPAGKYVLGLRTSSGAGVAQLNFYYPGVESVDKAAVLDFPAGGALVSLDFKLPPLIFRSGYGEVTMPDGSPANARLTIVDAAQPSASSEAWASGGQFYFYFVHGRRFHVYAQLDGVRDGKPVRYSGRALNQWDGAAAVYSYDDSNEAKFGPIKIVLDRVAPR